MCKRELDLKDNVVIDGNKYLLSTVDLIFCHIGGRFETMIFGYNGDGEINWADLYCNRYQTKEEAIDAHNKLLERLRNGERIWE